MIQGVYAAAVTTRRYSSHEPDLALMLDTVDFLTGHRVDGIALMSAVGEFVHFGVEERIRLTHFAIKRSRVPVLVNVSHSTLDGAVALAEAAVKDGAAGLLLMPPYFFRYNQQEIANFYFRFYGELATNIPILLYNIPQFSNDIDIDTAQSLLASEFFGGINVASASWDFLQTLLDQRVNQSHPFSVMIGQDSLFTRARPLGAQGVVSAVAAAVPELIVALDRAVMSNQNGRVEQLEQRLNEFLQWAEVFPTPVGVREAAQLRGIKVGRPAVPPSKESEKLLEQFRSWFADWLPAVVKESKL